MGTRAKARYRLEVESLEGRVVLSHGLRPAHVANKTAPTLTPAPMPVQVTSETVSQPQVVAPPSSGVGAADVTDVSVIQEGAAYVLFSSGPGIPIERSTDLVHWEPAGQVFAAVPAWAGAKVPGATSLWAPDISWFNGLYHVYYAVSEFGTNRSVIGLATSPTLDPASPAYRWTDRGEVIESRPGRTYWNAIDPQFVFDDDSQPWLAFGSQWSGVKLARIDPASGKLAGPSAHPRLTTLASRPASQPIEAPFIVSHDGSYFLFVSFDLCCLGASSTYKIMVGRSQSIAGPYLDRQGKPMTRGGGTLVVAGDDRYRGPGHNAVLSDGGQSWLFDHAYDALDGGRTELQVRPLGWDGDGWPVAGPPIF